MKDKIVYGHQGKDDMYRVWHASQENMIIYVKSEGGSIVTNENSYAMNSGILCFVGSGKHHYTMPDEPKRYMRHKLFISNDTLTTVLSLFSEKHAFKTLFLEDSFVYAKIPEEISKKVDDIFLEINAAKNKDDASFEILYVEGLLKLMSLIEQNVVDKAQAITKDILQRAVEYINGHIYEQITIDDICGVIHISKSHLCRQFKANMGITIMDYILKTRLTLAQNMLLKDKLTVGEVSERCAFSSISYFCRTFKKETGFTPRMYRKINGIMEKS